MRIGELAERAGVSTSTIRFYERRGLLPPAERLANGYRSYDERALFTVRFIDRAQSLSGLPGASMISLPFIRQHALDRHPKKLLTIPFALVTGVFEEPFFRNWIIDWLAEHGWAVALQVVFSRLAFGVAHAFWVFWGATSVPRFS